MNIKQTLFLTIARCFVFAGIATAIPVSQAADQQYTVCETGCDFPSLSAALSNPGTEDDTIILTETYLFDPLQEVGGAIPNGTTITCEEGADTIGDANENPLYYNTGSDFTLQDCTLENANFDSTGANNIRYLNNTFTEAAMSALVFTFVDTFEIKNNRLQYVTLQTADNGIITGNAFECRHDSRCISVVTAGSPDYSVSEEISSNVRITENIFTNFNTSTNGDWVIIVGGENIEFDHNTVRSAVTVDDTF